MAPTQLDRIEDHIVEIRREQSKQGVKSAVHEERIKQLEDDAKLQRARIWSVLLLIIGAGVTAGWAMLTGK